MPPLREPYVLFSQGGKPITATPNWPWSGPTALEAAGQVPSASRFALGIRLVALAAPFRQSGEP